MYLGPHSINYLLLLGPVGLSSFNWAMEYHIKIQVYTFSSLVTSKARKVSAGFVIV